MHQRVCLPGSCSMKERQNYLAWTTKMDHLLAKILTEQVKQGNKVDGTWKPAAYTAALQVLNENIGGGLTKEHIRSRLKTWKKQFRILKELLAHKGFEWDGAKKMVDADNSVWNNYIKANPNARHYRGKYIEHYDEWCIIMGELAIPTFSDDGAEVKEILTKSKDGADTLIVLDVQSSDKQAKKLRWTSDMDHYLGKTLVEYVMKGCKLDKTLQRGVLDLAVSALNEKYGPYLTKEHIRNRLKTWKKQYRILKELLSHDGFSWDETRKVIIANNSVWDDYIKEHPDAQELRTKSIENYNELCMIFGNEQKTEGWSIGEKHDKDRALNNHDHPEHQVRILDDEAGGGDGSSRADSIEASSQQTGTKPSSSSHSQKSLKRRRNGDIMVQIMSTMAVNVARIADAFSDSRRPTCLDQVFDVVQTMPGLDDDLILDACEFLSLDEKRAVMFMKLDERLRKKWLLKKLRS